MDAPRQKGFANTYCKPDVIIPNETLALNFSVKLDLSIGQRTNIPEIGCSEVLQVVFT